MRAQDVQNACSLSKHFLSALLQLYVRKSGMLQLPQRFRVTLSIRHFPVFRHIILLLEAYKDMHRITQM
jgi:hypothetical protein